MRSAEEAQRLMEAALNIAQTGADDAEVALGGGVVGLTRFADNVVHQTLHVDKETMSLRVLVGGRVGRSETSDLSTAGMQSAARQARMLAELLPEQDDPATLPEPQEYLTVEAFDAETERASALDRMAFIGRTVLRAQREGLRASGFVSTTYGTADNGVAPLRIYAIANTKGLAAYFAPTRAEFSVTMLDERGQSGWAQAESFALGQIDGDAIVEAAVQKARCEGPIAVLDSGEYTVILEPAAVSALLQFVALTCGAGDVAAKRSFLGGRIGQDVAHKSVTIYDDHLHTLRRGSPFDIEGVAKKRVVLIDEGVVKGPVCSFKNAVRDGCPPTGHKAISALYGETEAASHLVMGGGDSTLADLVGDTPRGLLVSRLSYTQLVDPKNLLLTGVTRDGTFLIEGGEVAGPVRNMRINVSLLDLLKNVDGITPEVASCGMVVPGVRVHGFPLTSGPSP